MEIHKVNVNKSDEATLIAEKIIDIHAREIILSVPRFAKLAESGANFRLLKREAEALGKKIIIESVDDEALGLAKASGLECLNPFFSEAKPKFSDIVTGPLRSPASEASKTKKEVRVEAVGESHREVGARHEAAVKYPNHRESRGHHEHPAQHIEMAKSGSRPGFERLAKFSVLTLIAIFIGGGLFLAIHVMPRADIKIVTARTSWAFKDAVTVDKTATQADSEAAKIPGQIFTQKKNLTLSFPASSRKRVAEKATGKIIIYNAHSSAPQPLVATTRFAAPDGKIFRLIERLTVPGAKIVQGRIEPSSIEARVVADTPGEAYNIGPVSKFTIPGFSGTPRFATFYAESKEAMSGGAIGETAYPNADDINKAKATVAKTLEEAMKTLILTQVPEVLKLIDGTTQFKLLKQEVDARVDASGKFSVFAEAELSLMLFKEQDMLAMLLGKIQAEAGPDFEVKSYKLTYNSPEFSAVSGKLTLPIDYEAVLAKKVDLEFLKDKIAGKSETDLKALIFSIAGLESAKISLWPFWVRSVPEREGRINITID